MKRDILIIAVLIVSVLAGCKDFNNVKVTYEVYSDASDAASIPDATVIYRGNDGADHTATVKVTPGFQYSMSVPLGTHINLRATTVLSAPDGISSLTTLVFINDAVINTRYGNCTNGVALAGTEYELICDFQGEARKIAQ
jgi:hypothetical protein